MNNTNQQSLLWHDYETFGVSPKKDHPSQFAAIRTDLDLNEIDEPVEYFCYPPADYLPNPEACLITRITPQHTFKKGMNEHQFITKVLAEMSKPNTCSVGYNTIRFDDEVTRYTAYRNLFSPYEREWKNGNSRWDIIDLVRACYALRPEGINWPTHEDGSPSFKLEDLTKANGLSHEKAHDAVSDVRATIAMARLIKEKQPKLYNYLFELRNKRKVAELIDINNMTPLVHISSKIKSVYGCCTWIVPIAWHPTNSNAIIVLNLALDPKPLANLTVDEIKQKLFASSDMLAPGEDRLPIKLIHLNKCPVLASAKTLSADNAERLAINREQCLANLSFIKANPDIREKLVSLYQDIDFEGESDADFGLYDGFASNADQAVMHQIQDLEPHQFDSFQPVFENPKFKTLWFRLKARNYPDTLTEQEMHQWRMHCQARLLDDSNQFGLSMNSYMQLIETLGQQHSQNPEKLKILEQLYQYAEQF